MAFFTRGETSLWYEVHGEGFPVLLFAPGGMRSAASFWARSPWNPIEALAPHFCVVAMDQRNAGRSRAPITERDGWHVYTDDHIALLDHLGIDRCHVLGGCIGGSYCLGIVDRAPSRVAAAVLQQPIGLAGGNRQAFYDMYDSWQKELVPGRPDVSAAAWLAFRERMYGGDFVFSVARERVASCSVPMLVLMGNDLYHPEETSREIVRLAPAATLVERWKEADVVGATVGRVTRFLVDHTPARSA